jgi:Type II secretion system (T2SS), protein E, N-terminal domain
MGERLKLGELLVETGLIGRDALESALERQKTDGRRIGEILVADGVISESKVTQVLSQQLSVPWVSLSHIDFSRQLLNLVPAECAEKYGLVPIYVRRAKNREQTLYVAMTDPTDPTPLEEVARFSGLPVRPMIAPASDIRGAIRAYYLGIVDEEIPAISAAHIDVPEPIASDPPARMVTVTLLDGTELRLPASSKSSRAPATTRLTALDLIEALRIQAQGGNASEVLGEDTNWEMMFAALLSLLLKKKLIHDWEFIEELNRP